MFSFLANVEKFGAKLFANYTVLKQFEKFDCGGERGNVVSLPACPEVSEFPGKCFSRQKQAGQPADWGALVQGIVDEPRRLSEPRTVAAALAAKAVLIDHGPTC